MNFDLPEAPLNACVVDRYGNRYDGGTLILPDKKISVVLYSAYEKNKKGGKEIKDRANEAANVYQTWGLFNGEARQGAVPITSLNDVTDKIRAVVEASERYFLQTFIGPHQYGYVEIQQSVKIATLAIFAHGLPYSISLNKSNSHYAGLHTEKCGGESNVEHFVASVQNYLTNDVQILLFACLTGGKSAEQEVDGCAYTEAETEWYPPPQIGQRSGEDSLADRLAKALHKYGKDNATVMAHTTAGHVTDNYAARQFRFDGQGGGIHIFDLIYDAEFKNSRPIAELRFYAPNRRKIKVREGDSKGQYADMWTHYRCSVNPNTGANAEDGTESICRRAYLGYEPPDYGKRSIGLEMFFNIKNAKTLLQSDWKNKHPSPNSPNQASEDLQPAGPRS
jgi:hypothetical protein